jgi:hypothetical protein
MRRSLPPRTDPSYAGWLAVTDGFQLPAEVTERLWQALVGPPIAQGQK